MGLCFCFVLWVRGFMGLLVCGFVGRWVFCGYLVVFVCVSACACVSICFCAVVCLRVIVCDSGFICL